MVTWSVGPPNNVHVGPEYTTSSSSSTIHVMKNIWIGHCQLKQYGSCRVTTDFVLNRAIELAVILRDWSGTFNNAKQPLLNHRQVKLKNIRAEQSRTHAG